MERFTQNARRIRERAYQTKLAILVWGPGNPGTTASAEKLLAYNKRVQIRDILRTKFPNAEVYFSEDIQMKRLSRGILGQLNKETLQAKAADLIILLDLSRGVDLELDYFVPKYAWFPVKSYVLLPKQYIRTKGLVKEILDYFHPSHIIGFTPQDINECKVATVRAIEIAFTAALNQILTDN